MPLMKRLPKITGLAEYAIHNPNSNYIDRSPDPDQPAE